MVLCRTMAMPSTIACFVGFAFKGFNADELLLYHHHFIGGDDDVDASRFAQSNLTRCATQ